MRTRTEKLYIRFALLIAASTRKVYLKKLIKLLESGDVLDSQEQSFEEGITRVVFNRD